MLQAPNASKLIYVLKPYVYRGNDKWSRLFKVYLAEFHRPDRPVGSVRPVT